MNDGGPDAPLQKRRKIILEGPSGFEKTKAAPRSRAVSVQRPELVEELQHSHTSIPARKQAASSTKPVSSRQRTVSQFGAPPQFETNNAPRSKKPLSESAARSTLPSFILPTTDDKGKQLEISKKPLKTSDGPRTLPQFTLPTSKAVAQEKVPSSKKVLQAPDVSDVFQSDTKLQSLRLQPRPLPILPLAGSSTSTPLYQLRPPPPLPVASSVDEAPNLKTLSTTGIARATDLNTASGNAELAHIFLQDQHPDLIQSGWNIGLSPSKKASGVVAKGSGRFLRGGLAARAFDIKQRDQTDLILWQKEIENRLSSTSTKRVNSHLQLRIVEILERPAGPKPTSPRKRRTTHSNHSTGDTTQTAPGVAICKIISKSPPPSLILDSTTTSNITLLHAFEKRHEQNILAVFSFPRIAPSALEKRDKIYARNPEDFAEGMEVHVWEPWREVLFDTRKKDPSAMDVDEPHGDNETRGFLPRPFPLPLSLPRSSQGSQPGGDKPLANVVLLCERFVMMT